MLKWVRMHLWLILYLLALIWTSWFGGRSIQKEGWGELPLVLFTMAVETFMLVIEWRRIYQNTDQIKRFDR